MSLNAQKTLLAVWTGAFLGSLLSQLHAGWELPLLFGGTGFAGVYLLWVWQGPERAKLQATPPRQEGGMTTASLVRDRRRPDEARGTVTESKPDVFKQYPHVEKAFALYVRIRLREEGNKPQNLKKLLREFARWHGPENLNRGILRETPRPIDLSSICGD